MVLWYSHKESFMELITEISKLHSKNYGHISEVPLNSYGYKAGVVLSKFNQIQNCFVQVPY